MSRFLSSDERSLSHLHSDGCLRDRLSNFCVTIHRTLGANGPMLIYKDPYRVTTVGHFLHGPCRGLVIMSCVYHNVTSPLCFGRFVGCLRRGRRSAIICCGTGDGRLN